jgi:hypothetical protein
VRRGASLQDRVLRTQAANRSGVQVAERQRRRAVGQLLAIGQERDAITQVQRLGPKQFDESKQIVTCTIGSSVPSSMLGLTSSYNEKKVSFDSQIHRKGANKQADRRLPKANKPHTHGPQPHTGHLPADHPGPSSEAKFSRRKLGLEQKGPSLSSSSSSLYDFF